MSDKKIVNGRFSDNRISELHDKILDFTRTEAIKLQMPLATVVGILENIKHEIQHEFLPIDSDQIDYG